MAIHRCPNCRRRTFGDYSKTGAYCPVCGWKENKMDQQKRIEPSETKPRTRPRVAKMLREAITLASRHIAYGTEFEIGGEPPEILLPDCEPEEDASFFALRFEGPAEVFVVQVTRKDRCSLEAAARALPPARELLSDEDERSLIELELESLADSLEDVSKTEVSVQDDDGRRW